MRCAMRDPSNTNGEAKAVARLKRRADFLRVGKGRRWHGKAMTIQAAARPSEGRDDVGDGARVGFTLTKKVGNSVVRNRARRRLREALRCTPGLPVKADHDYVLVGRIDAVRLSFAELSAELARGLAAVGSNEARRGGGAPGKPKPDKGADPRPGTERIRPAR